MVFASVDHMSNNTCNAVKFVRICHPVKTRREETFLYKPYELNADYPIITFYKL